MADKVIVSKSKLIAIGDAIRSKTGKTDSMTLDTMSTEISNISSGSNGSCGVIEVDTLPETGEEGCVYLVNTIDQVYMYYASDATYVTLRELMQIPIDYEIVNELPTENIIQTTETYGYIYIYNNTLMVYMNDAWVNMSDIMNIPYNGIVYSTEEMSVTGLYTLMNKIYYIYKDNTFNQISSSGEITHISNYNNFEETYDVSQYSRIKINNYVTGNINNRSAGILYYHSNISWVVTQSFSGGVGNILVFLTLGNNVSITGSNYQIMHQDDNLILIRLTDNGANLTVTNS